MKILAIDTSCDETAVAITEGRRVLASVIYSQVLIHKKWGGVVPSLAKRAHEERIDLVIFEALKKFNSGNKFLFGSELAKARTSTTSQNFITAVFKNVDYLAVTQGPGLAIALEVGIAKAKELAKKYNKKLIAVNHLEGHIYSCFVKNSQGKPTRPFNFPYLGLIISGGHTEIVVFKNHLIYEVIGRTLDDAAGEALDKAAKLLGLGYPGGAAIERLADDVDNRDFFKFPRPMFKSSNCDFSFSGLKTSFYYYLKNITQSEKNSKIKELASSFQAAVFDTLILKTEKAIKATGIKNLVVGGGVIANLNLREKFRKLVKSNHGTVIFPSYKYLTGDNAAMIGVVAGFKAEKNLFVKNSDNFGSLDRIPRMSL